MSLLNLKGLSDVELVKVLYEVIEEYEERSVPFNPLFHLVSLIKDRLYESLDNDDDEDDWEDD